MIHLGIYIHIPFCNNKKCDYCDFYSIPCNPSHSNFQQIKHAYINTLASEIIHYSSELKNYLVDTIYIGGGTPSLLQSSDYMALLTVLHDHYAIASEVEITLECNPDDYSKNYIQQLSHIGFNRFILGVQTLDARAHNYIGRKSRLCTIEEIQEFCTIPDIIPCVDIIVGIPVQSVTGYRSMLNSIIQCNPKHISAYMLTYETNTPLRLRTKNPLQYANFQRNMFQKTINALEASGYNHYEISNFSIPDYESKHNLKYWNFESYIGFGSGAHSFYNNKRYYNATIDDYMNDAIASRTEDIRTQQDSVVEYCMNKLRLKQGFMINDMHNKTGYLPAKSFYQSVHRLIDKSFLIMKNCNGDICIQCTDEGMFMLDTILLELASSLL